MKILIITVFLSIMVRDVYSVRGLFASEVTIFPEGQVPTDSEDEVTCTIATIEPAGTDVKFAKYVASPVEAVCQSPNWRDNDTASTFEECADAAAGSRSKMFLYENGKCQISDVLYNQTDICSKSHSQLVYVDVDADTGETRDTGEIRKLMCNYDWTVPCVNGRPINTFTLNADACTDMVYGLKTFDGLYHIVSSNDLTVEIRNQYAECSKHGALPCAPKDDASLDQFIDDLKAFQSELGDVFAVAMNSSDNGSSYVWSTNVDMPDAHTEWAAAVNLTDTTKSCATMGSSGLEQYSCDSPMVICCMIPYYAD